MHFGKDYKQEAQGHGALLDKMEDNDHIKLDNTEIYGVTFTLRPAVFETQGVLEIRNTPNDHQNYLKHVYFTSILYTLNTPP